MIVFYRDFVFLKQTCQTYSEIILMWKSAGVNLQSITREPPRCQPLCGPKKVLWIFTRSTLDCPGWKKNKAQLGHHGLCWITTLMCSLKTRTDCHQTGYLCKGRLESERVRLWRNWLWIGLNMTKTGWQMNRELYWRSSNLLLLLISRKYLNTKVSEIS